MKTPARRLLIFIILFSLVALHTVHDFANGEGDKSNQEDRAQDFILKDTAGKIVKLSDYRGKTILLYFMATWCPECRGSIPKMKELYSDYAPKGLVLLAVDVMESREKVASFSKKYDISFPMLLDEDGKVYRDYGVGGVPVKALIDKTGRIICWNCRSFENLLAKQFEGKAK